MEKFRKRLKGWGAENGSEFLDEFDRYLREVRIEHDFDYLRNPKGNG